MVPVITNSRLCDVFITSEDADSSIICVITSKSVTECRENFDNVSYDNIQQAYNFSKLDFGLDSLIMSSKVRDAGIYTILGIIIGLFIVPFLQKMIFDDGIVVPMDEFPEPAWRTPSTLAVKTVTSTAFARFEIHKVRTESGAIVNDWLW